MSADIFVYLDTVQFTKNGLQNRNQIKTATGASWLTVPVKHEFGQRICEVEIANQKAVRKHWQTLGANYARTDGFRQWREELKQLLGSDFNLLTDLAVGSTEWLLEKLNVRAKRVKASELSGVEGEASKLVASICKQLGATTYLSGSGALAYLQQTDFSDIGCELMIQAWTPFTYKQTHEELGFIPNLSTLDLVLNCPDTAGSLIQTAGAWFPLEGQ